MRNRTPRTMVMLAAVAAITTLAACTSTPDPAAETAGVTPEPDGLAFAQCMRENGVEMSDPDPATGIPVLGESVDRSSAAVQDAMTACQDLLPAGRREAASATDTDGLLAFAQCVRENGLPDFPDPQPGSGGAFAAAGVDRSDPVFQQAAQVCSPLLGGTQ